jgi:predicted ArsR family transcriptional regulator
MPTDELSPLALQVLMTLSQTYDLRGPDAFDEDAAKIFHVIGSIIAQVCGRERLAKAVETLQATLEMEGIGETRDSPPGSLH